MKEEINCRFPQSTAYFVFEKTSLFFKIKNANLH